VLAGVALGKLEERPCGGLPVGGIFRIEQRLCFRDDAIRIADFSGAELAGGDA